MADAYMIFQDSTNQYLASDSVIQITDQGELGKPFTTAATRAPSALHQIVDYSFDIEQTLAIGSATVGAGAGKVTFNPFSITRRIDSASPVLFEMACSGKHFTNVRLGLATNAGAANASRFFLVYTFKVMAVKTIAHAHSDDAPMETITFEYGDLIMQLAPQRPDGTLGPIKSGGWNRVRNIADQNPTGPI